MRGLVIAGTTTIGWQATRRFGLWLGVVALGGFTLRVTYVVVTREARVPTDGLYFHYGAISLAEGEGFVDPLLYLLRGQIEPGAVHPPAWLVTLAGPSLLGFQTQLEHQLFACLIGSATIVLVGLAGRRIAGAGAGVVAALIAALYPNFWMYERQLLSETLILLGVALAILIAYRHLDRPGLITAMALGAVCGYLALTRTEQLLLLVVLLAPVVLLTRDVPWRRRLGWFASGLAAAAVVIVPWVAYNATRFEGTVVISTNFGVTVRAANCQHAYYGSSLGFRERYGELHCPSDTSSSSEASAGGDASTRSDALQGDALDYVRDHAARVPIVLAAREGRTWGVFRPFQQMRFDAQRGAPLWLIRLGFFAYWMLAAAAVYGALVLRRRRVPLFPLMAFVITVFVAVALTFGQTRYRAPADISIVLLAAVAVDAAVSHRRAAGFLRQSSSG